MRPTPGLAFATLVGTIAYLAIAIAGWGGIGAFFANPARVALTIVLFALAVAALFSGGNVSSGMREDRGNRWVLGAFGVLGLLAAYLPAFTDRIGFWTLDGDTVRWLGVALFAAGGVLRLWPVFVLGRRFSGLVAIQPGHTLVSSHKIVGKRGLTNQRPSHLFCESNLHYFQKRWKFPTEVTK